MPDPILVCNGVTIGGIFIPPFQLMPGESICLQWPVPKTHNGVKLFVDHLLKNTNSCSILVKGEVAICDPVHFITTFIGSQILAYYFLPLLPMQFQRKLEAIKAIRYYQLEENKSRLLEANDLRQMRTLFKNENISPLNLQASDRIYLAFQKLKQKSDVVIFDTLGCTSEKLYE